jgi:hypothetical protein
MNKSDTTGDRSMHKGGTSGDRSMNESDTTGDRSITIMNESTPLLSAQNAIG